MNLDEFIIQGLLKNKTKSKKYGRTDPLEWEYIEEYFSMFDFEFPYLLKKIYHQVSDGGFGPGLNGIVGISGGGNPGLFGKDLIEWYFFMIDKHLEDDEIAWPHGLIPLCDYGCGIISSVWCLSGSDKFPIIRSDPNMSFEKLSEEIKAIDSVNFNKKYNKVCFCSYVEYNDASTWLGNFIY